MKAEAEAVKNGPRVPLTGSGPSGRMQVRRATGNRGGAARSLNNRRVMGREPRYEEKGFSELLGLERRV